MSILKVECQGFEVELNCSLQYTDLPWGVGQHCCQQYANKGVDSEPQKALQDWYRCCDSLKENGLAAPDMKDWDNSSYQAYVMGVAVFAILMCLFISGARSIRRRHSLARAGMRQMGNQGGLHAHPPPELCTRVSLGPPTYGELEEGGLTSDYKSGSLNPPPYPGIIEESEYDFECPSFANETETPSVQEENKTSCDQTAPPRPEDDAPTSSEAEATPVPAEESPASGNSVTNATSFQGTENV